MNHENAYRRMILHSVGTDYLKSLGRLNQMDSVFRILKVWAYYIIFFGIYSFFVQTGKNHLLLYLVPAWIVLLINFNRINVITHDASHFQMFKSKKANDLLTNILASYSAMHDVQQYRKSHLVHHRSLHTEADPDREFYILSRKIILEDLFFITFLKQLVSNKSKTKKSAFVYIFQFVLLGILFLINRNIPETILYYILFFLFPLTTLFVLVLRIRTHIQHYTETEDIVTRTTTPPFIEKLFIGQKMEYHLEHHLFPGIPYYNLEALHHKLLQTSYRDAALHALITKTYFTNVH
jgi:fatty acid desaturase